MEDVLLGRSSLFASVNALRNYEAWNELTNLCKNGLNKMVEGKEHKFRGFPEASGGFHGRSFTVWPQQRKK